MRVSPDILSYANQQLLVKVDRQFTLPQCAGVDNNGTLNFCEIDCHGVDVDAVKQKVEVLPIHIDDNLTLSEA